MTTNIIAQKAESATTAATNSTTTLTLAAGQAAPALPPSTATASASAAAPESSATVNLVFDLLPLPGVEVPGAPAAKFILAPVTSSPGSPGSPAGLADCVSDANPGPDQPLYAFKQPFKAFLIAEGGRDAKTVNNIISRLNTLDDIWTAFKTVPANRLRKKHISALQSDLNRATVPVMGDPYGDDTKNVINSAVRQLLEYLCDELEYISDETFAKLVRRLKFAPPAAVISSRPSTTRST